MFADVICWELSFVDNTCGNIGDEFFRAISEVLNAGFNVGDNLFVWDFWWGRCKFRTFCSTSTLVFKEVLKKCSQPISRCLRCLNCGIHSPGYQFFACLLLILLRAERARVFRNFLDTLIIRQGNDLKIDVFRKPTHTDRYLHFNSHQDIKHKN